MQATFKGWMDIMYAAVDANTAEVSLFLSDFLGTRWLVGNLHYYSIY